MYEGLGEFKAVDLLKTPLPTYEGHLRMRKGVLGQLETGTVTRRGVEVLSVVSEWITSVKTFPSTVKTTLSCTATAGRRGPSSS